MKIATDLEYIKEIATEKEDENWEFRIFLKQSPVSRPKIDAIVHKLVDEVTAQIDCTKCANCCRQTATRFDNDDQAKFASGLNMSASEFQEQYLTVPEYDPSALILNQRPCPFLENNLCTNYDYRPKVCRSYPHIHKKDFVSRTLGVLNNYEICPIVFNVYERLKGELWHRNGFWSDDEID
ncbi:MAG: YkgJ family cysteine cluster protein [Chloroflexi bacterium]|nr:YkgJ family cysteine cluster protein [Chloroflexota bacterium]